MMNSKAVEDYARQCAVLKRIVLELPVTEGTSREFRSAAIVELNAALRAGAVAKKADVEGTRAFQESSQKAHSKFPGMLEGMMSGLQYQNALVGALREGNKALNKLRSMLATSIAKTHVPPPVEMPNRLLAEHLQLYLSSMVQQKVVKDKTFDKELLEEAIKRLSM